ncbi:MAG: phytoene/squalene synthase family protein [Chitinophagaceae bacterium]
MVQLFHQVSDKCSQVVTENYSSSFSSAIRLLHKDLRTPIYNIYGFVRFADEIVDTFHEHEKSTLLTQFKQETYEALQRGISLNPILNSFQRTVREYNIETSLIDSFFRSMELDLSKKEYDQAEYEEYVYGSAETVGLMCLNVFCEGNLDLYDQLKNPARSLGAAFQKVNFLRDFKADYNGLSRIYFPGCDFHNFSESQKRKIEDDIEKDFQAALQGILRLPVKARFGVYVAYKYYYSLFSKIKNTHSTRVLKERIRIPNYVKVLIILRAGLKNQFHLI